LESRRGKRTRRKRKEEKREVHNKLNLLNLDSEEAVSLDDVQSFRFLKGSGFVVAQRYRGPGKTEGGSDLFISNLADGSSITIGNVASFALNKEETLLALDIESDSKNSGVQIYDPAARKLTTVVWGKESVTNLVWADKTDALAFMRATPDDKKDGDWNTIILATNLKSKPVVTGMDVTKLSGFPQGKRVAEFGGLFLDDDAKVVGFGIKDWQDKKKAGKPDEKAAIDVWHWKDLDIQPKQRTMAPTETRRTALCFWRPADNSFLQVTDDKIRNATVLSDVRHAVLYDQSPYRKASTNGITHQDVYVLDLANGQKKQILTKTQWGVVPSRKGKYLAYYNDKNWWIYDIAAGQAKNVTQSLGAHFEDLEDDHTVPERPMATSPTWLADDKGVIVGTRYDRWLVDPSGKATKLTDGEKNRVRYSLMDVERHEDGVNTEHPLFFSTFDEETKKAGYYLWRPGAGGKTLVADDKSFGSLVKSKDTDRMIFTAGTFRESPNAFVTNMNFDAFKPLTKTNSQQAGFLWGKTELIHFKSKWGKSLQATLIYPADYKPGTKYPMVTYIYERLSDGLNSYIMPNELSSYNQQVMSQNGYFVFMPDMAYHGRNPGLSAVECLEPAVDAALKAQPDINSAKVGLMGHSWGGYQTAFAVTQSKKFAAAVAGAPLTELKSMYLSIYGNSGTAVQELLETGQGRLEVPFWVDPKTYEANSPVYHADKITAPLMMAQGNADGAVDFHQGMYMFNTMRRLGKECIFLVYDGENHNFTKRPNQLDYARRLRHFFDVYLKGAKPESWVTDGVPFLKKDGI
jgi:dipeptidyl aminopeptidase/acylaminoacyl peptidase